MKKITRKTKGIMLALAVVLMVGVATKLHLNVVNNTAIIDPPTESPAIFTPFNIDPPTE